jgi:hypothetical protein
MYELHKVISSKIWLALYSLLIIVWVWVVILRPIKKRVIWAYLGLFLLFWCGCTKQRQNALKSRKE